MPNGLENQIKIVDLAKCDEEGPQKIVIHHRKKKLTRVCICKPASSTLFLLHIYRIYPARRKPKTTCIPTFFNSNFLPFDSSFPLALHLFSHRQRYSRPSPIHLVRAAHHLVFICLFSPPCFAHPHNPMCSSTVLHPLKTNNVTERHHHQPHRRDPECD